MKKNIFIGLISLIAVSIILFGFQKDKVQTPSDYVVLVEEGTNKLAQEVKSRFAQGFECIGGVSSYKDSTNKIFFIQAMVK